MAKRKRNSTRTANKAGGFSVSDLVPGFLRKSNPDMSKMLMIGGIALVAYYVYTQYFSGSGVAATPAVGAGAGTGTQPAVGGGYTPTVGTGTTPNTNTQPAVTQPVNTLPAAGASTTVNPNLTTVAVAPTATVKAKLDAWARSNPAYQGRYNVDQWAWGVRALAGVSDSVGINEFIALFGNSDRTAGLTLDQFWSMGGSQFAQGLMPGQGLGNRNIPSPVRVHAASNAAWGGNAFN